MAAKPERCVPASLPSSSRPSLPDFGAAGKISADQQPQRLPWSAPRLTELTTAERRKILRSIRRENGGCWPSDLKTETETAADATTETAASPAGQATMEMPDIPAFLDRRAAKS